MWFQFERQGKMGFGSMRPWAVVSIIALLGLASCSRFGDRTKDVINAISMDNLSNGQTLLKNDASDVRLTLPKGWIDVQNLRPDADLYVAREDKKMYVLVLADPKGSEIGRFDLDNNADQYLSFLDRGMSQEQTEVKTDITALNGLAAVQYEVRGRVDNLPVVYLHTTIEGAEDYYQVVAWTTAEDYDAAKGELQSVIGSFRGT